MLTFMLLSTTSNAVEIRTKIGEWKGLLGDSMRIYMQEDGTEKYVYLHARDKNGFNTVSYIARKGELEKLRNVINKAIYQLDKDKPSKEGGN